MTEGAQSGVGAAYGEIPLFGPGAGSAASAGMTRWGAGMTEKGAGMAEDRAGMAKEGWV